MEGEFPSGVDQVSAGKYAATYVMRMGIEKGNGPSAEQMKEVLKIARGFQFVMFLTEESDAHYADKNAKRGAPNLAVFWYKPADSEKYRVLYADLSIKEADTTPNVPGAIKLKQ